MITLALDSTEITAAAAIADGKKLLAETVINTRLNHSETLLPAIEGLMRGTGCLMTISIFLPVPKAPDPLRG